MNLKQIIDRLNAEFTGETRKLVFWYDDIVARLCDWLKAVCGADTLEENFDYIAKALVYLHRYTPDTIGNLCIDYLHKMQRVYESEINRIQDMMDHSENAREVAAASKRKDKLAKQLKECRE